MERAQALQDRAADRAKRLEDGDIDADEARREAEEEAKADAADAGEGEREEKEEAIVIPPPVVRHTPLAFCCVGCHAVLLAAGEVQRVYGNTVWGKAGVKPPGLIRNTGEQWQQTRAEVDAGAEDEEGGEEAGEDEAGPGVKAPKVYDTSAVYCAQCYAYVGRHYADRDAYRLVYIDRLTGRNWMYVQGDMASLHLRLLPLLSTPTPTDAEADDEEEGEGDGGPTPPLKEDEVPVVVGLPASYVSVAQALRYPFPRFPLPIIAAQLPPSNPNFATLTPAAITRLQAASPDPVWDVGSVEGARLAAMDARYAARLLLTVVTQHLLALFGEFESPQPASPYHPPSASPIPAFTHFYLSPPEMAHARGTARYAWHYLTGKDDSKVKRYGWGLKRVREMMVRWDAAVLLVMAGGWGGMRAIVVKVGEGYRVYQSNDRVKAKGRRYGLREWVKEGGRWSRVLDGEEMGEWYGQFERARRGEKAVWEELFCRGDEVLSLQDAPQDRFKDSECQFSIARLLPDNLHMD